MACASAAVRHAARPSQHKANAHAQGLCAGEATIGVPHTVQHASPLHENISRDICAAPEPDKQCHSPWQLLANAGPGGLSPRDMNTRAIADKLPGNWVVDPEIAECPPELVDSPDVKRALTRRTDAIRKLLEQYHESFHHFSAGQRLKRWSLACFDLPPGASQDEREARRAGQLL